MGQDPGNGSTVEELRHDIERTRAGLGETAAALGAKADVRGRAKERVHEIRENVAAKTPSSAGQATTAARQNPVPAAAIAALVVGFALGWVIAGHRAG
jgi:ElaB/YqjD/DUF883 family membrane-anchored ribosome-binding protein